ncbi:MAG: amidohydrolase family protein [Ktedonobacterales bacterium]
MIVDFHTHIFPPEIIADRSTFIRRDPWLGELYSNPGAKMASADDLLASMDAEGIDVSVACSFGWQDPGLVRTCNSYLIQVMRDHPGRIIGLAGVQPLAGQQAVAELERCANAGMPGFGELMPHGQGYRLADITLLAPLAEVATHFGMFALTHTSEPVGHLYQGKGDVTPQDLQSFIRAFPGLRVVAAHWGGGFPFYELMPEVREVAANLWYDSAASPYLYRPEIFPLVAGIAGVHKILWGSDYPLISQGRMLSYTRKSGLNEQELELALGGNAAAFLNIGGGSVISGDLR